MQRALRAMRTAYALPAVSSNLGKNTGPVTEAIRTMRAADPACDANPGMRALRRALADRIEADIAALDMLGGDPDREDGADTEYSLCGVGTHDGGSGTLRPSLAITGRLLDDNEADDDREEENEHGGDIQDVPHDEEYDERDTAPEWTGHGVHLFTVGGFCL